MKTRFYINDVCLAQAVEGGVRVLFDDEGRYAWGEFIADADFHSDMFEVIELASADFGEKNPFAQRTFVEDAYASWQGVCL